MSKIMNIINEFSGKCECGRKHEAAVRDIRIGRGLTNFVGDILKENGFSENLLLVADKNTLKASDGIEKSLAGFNVEYKIYDFIRIAEMKHVEELERIIKGRDISVLSVGSGSVNDPCRLACSRQSKKLCIFATAPSMDGFASYSSPIVKDGFKLSFAAKCPEVIIGDAEVLAAAPAYLKSAGFGDMIAKYIALADWRISALLTGEYYCEKVASLTKNAVDSLMTISDIVTENNAETAGKIFECLLMTGIAMSFTKNSRPASGSEHIIAHFIECLQLAMGKIPNYHGEDVGVCTLEMLKYYNKLAEKEKITPVRENVNFEDVYRAYGNMAEEVRILNAPTTVTDDISLEKLENSWEKIRNIIYALPSYDKCFAAMKKAGCKLSVEDIGLDRSFFDYCVKYSPYMRRRLTLLRMKDMIK